jgi:ATP-dependent RNA helicase DHX36
MKILLYPIDLCLYRVQSGVCYHLFSRGREAILADYPLPEMLRTRLEEVILSIKLLQLGKAAPFLEKVMDPPNPRAVSLAIQVSYKLCSGKENGVCVSLTAFL